MNMKENFWRDLPRPFFVLAPMEDVTDVVFRHVVSKAGKPDVFFTEFTNTESYCHPEGQKSVRGRLIFTEVDIEAKIKSCAVMNCADPLIEGIQVDLDAAPRILYWVNLDNQMVQYSGTSTLEALSLTTESATRLAGKLHIHDSAAGGPTLDVTFDTPILKTFTKHR